MFKAAGLPNPFNDAGNIHAFNNLLDAWGAPRGDPHKHRLHKPAEFFAQVRRIVGSLDQVQVDIINRMLEHAAHWPIGWVAYALATAAHESRLRPIHEMGGPRYLAKYDTGRLAAALGNTPEADGDGIKFAGRGLVQLTGRTNYSNAGQHLGLDLLADPDLALDPDIAVRLLVWGMEGGRFTGRRLSHFIDGRGTLRRFTDARRIINGTDRADMIARLALKFQDALDVGEWQ